MKSTIHFYGGAGAVTGSNFLLESGGTKILVDCGLAQGASTAEEANWKPFPYDPSLIQFLLVTHAHIDHIGRIPKLVKDGFRGRIISTEATKALARPMLLDSMELLADVAQKHGREVLYAQPDVEAALKLWEGIGYHKSLQSQDGFSFEFINSGHILGSGMVLLRRKAADGQERSMVFSGDLGGGNSPLLSAAEVPTGVSYMLLESVYGNRVRNKEEVHREVLENIIEDTAKRGGTLLIPAFSTERTQDLLFEIRTLMTEKRIPSMPVYVDSPLASKITAAFLECPQYFSAEMQKRIAAGEHIFSFPELHFVEDAKESAKITRVPGPKILLAGSGMSSGGRVHNHQKILLPDPKSTLLIVGYQAAGSLGRRIIEGEKNVHIEGQMVPVHCKVQELYGYSAHMDSEQLLEFASGVGKSLQQIFVVMGEPASAAFLAQRIRDYLGIHASTPEAGEKAEIDL